MSDTMDGMVHVWLIYTITMHVATRYGQTQSICKEKWWLFIHLYTNKGESSHNTTIYIYVLVEMLMILV